MKIIKHATSGQSIVEFMNWEDRVASTQVGDVYLNEDELWVVYGVGETGIAIRKLDGDKELVMLRANHLKTAHDMPRTLRPSEARFRIRD